MVNYLVTCFHLAFIKAGKHGVKIIRLSVNKAVITLTIHTRVIFSNHLGPFTFIPKEGNRLFRQFCGFFESVLFPQSHSNQVVKREPYWSFAIKFFEEIRIVSGDIRQDKFHCKSLIIKQQTINRTLHLRFRNRSIKLRKYRVGEIILLLATEGKYRFWIE